MSERLPKKFMEQGLALAKGASFFGHPLEDFSKEELLAIAAKGWKAEHNARDEAARQMDFMASLQRRRA